MDPIASTDSQRSVAEQLSAHLPRLLTRRLASRGALPAAASHEALAGAFLFCDISGFTALTEKLAPLGPRGAEQLSELLNDFYGRMVERIHACGGDVVAFAGDAVLAIWPGAPAGALRAAAECALVIRRELSGAEPRPGVRLRVRSALGVGRLDAYELGGVEGRWFAVVAGEAIEHAKAADGQAYPGDVVLSAEAAALLGGDASTWPLDAGVVRLRALRGEAAPRASAPAPDVAPAAVLAAYLPEVVATRVALGQAEFLAELRPMTVAFISLGEASPSREPSLERLQAAVTTIQHELARFEGGIYQCLRDDKGFVVIAVFGMPPRAHEDDAARACLAALGIRERLLAQGQRSAIGIASGRLFCGAYGHERRRQYSVVGSTINLAARLMQASHGDGILCDEATEREARRQLDFAPLDPVPVRGRAEPVFAFRPAGRRAPARAPARTELIGRQSEFDRIARGLEIAAQGRPGGCFLVEADAGMGKSTLLAAVCDHARARGLSVARGQADSIESSTAYFPLRGVFVHALGLAGEPRPEDVERAARGRLRGAAELEPLLPLLKAVVSIELPENERTRQMTGQVRADNTSRLLLGILLAAARESPLLLAVEDGHWMDSASWGLLLQIARLRAPLTVLLTTRPLAEPQPAYQGLCALAGSTHLALASMEAADLAALVAHRLGVERLPEAMRRLLAERAGGNPFHAEEIALALRDKGLITVAGGACRVVSEAALAELVLPDTLLGTIAARVDRLPAAAQLTAKVASAIGRVFETSMLRGVHPIADDRGALPDHLELLTRADLICPEPKQHEPAHAFRHAVIQESLYQLLSFAQRRSLNRAAAEHLEANHADRASIVARLAFHYSEAEMAPEAMSALLAAGEQALDAYANREAVRFLARSLEFPEAARRPRLERVQTHRHLCEAHYALTEYGKSRQAAADALRAAGCRVPDGTLRGIAAELVTLWRQALREALTGRRAAALDADAREARIAACYAIGSVMSVFAFEGEALASAQGALQVYNMGAAVEPSAVTSGGRLGYGLLLSRLGWWGRAEPMLRRAVREAEASGDVLHVIQAYALFGQQWTGVGDFEQAAKWLDRADTLANDLGTSMWRHRTKLELSNALMCLGRYEECVRQTELGGRIALDAEPKSFGIFLAKQALALLRLGRDDEAQPLLDEGLARSREHSAALPLFVAFGGLAELHLRRGDPEAALAAAREAERIALTEKGADAFFPSVHGHAGICQVYLELWRLGREAGDSAPVLSLAEARAGARRACRLLAAFARIYPSARPLHDLMEGRRQHLLGRAARAERRWRRAEAGAEATGQPHESALARLWLGLHGPQEERAAQLERAAATFSRYGMAYELRSLAGAGV